MSQSEVPQITVSIATAALRLDVDRSTIKRLIEAGELTTSKLSESKQGKRLVHYDSLVALIERRSQKKAASE
jgi:Helix-turn-helix domain